MQREKGLGLARLQMIWYAITFSLVIYGVLALVLVPAEGAFGYEGSVVILALGAASIGIFASAMILPRVLAAAGREEPPPTGPTPSAISAFEVSQRVSMAIIVRLALMESIAIFGLVAAFLSNDWRWYLPFGAFSLLGLVVSWPSASFVRDLDERRRR